MKSDLGATRLVSITTGWEPRRWDEQLVPNAKRSISGAMGNDVNAAERIADFPPSVEGLTDYDRANAVTYLRLLDADADGADWEAVAAAVLNLDVDSNPERAHSVWAANLKRAKWMTVSGFRHLLPDAGHSPGR